MVQDEAASQLPTLQVQQPFGQRSQLSQHSQNISHLSQHSQNFIPHDPLQQALFWNNMNRAPVILDQRLAQVSNLMLSQGSQLPPQPTGFDFVGGHL
jgi:hypothetical protein